MSLNFTPKAYYSFRYALNFNNCKKRNMAVIDILFIIYDSEHWTTDC